MMNRAKKILIGGLGMILVPSFVLAHGGVERSIGNVTVYLTQSPISPLVGEKVRMTFVLGMKNGTPNDRLRNFGVKLILIDTYYGDESKDRIILAKNIKTDANGAFEFEYTFDKENYFDVELAFDDPVTNANEKIGFLVQPRLPAGAKIVEIEKEKEVTDWAQLFLAGLSGLAIGLIGGKFGSRL